MIAMIAIIAMLCPPPIPRPAIDGKIIILQCKLFRAPTYARHGTAKHLVQAVLI